MGQDGARPAGTRGLSCAGTGSTGSKGIVSGRPCGRDTGRVPGGGWKGQLRLGHGQWLECQVEGLEFLSDGDRGQTVQGTMSREAEGFHVQLHSAHVHGAPSVCQAQHQALGGGQRGSKADAILTECDICEGVGSKAKRPKGVSASDVSDGPEFGRGVMGPGAGSVD